MSSNLSSQMLTVGCRGKKTVVVTLWGDLATNIGNELLEIADKSPVVAIKSVKVWDFGGVSLSAMHRSLVMINPDVPEARKLRSSEAGIPLSPRYDSEGKDAAMVALRSGSIPSSNSGIRSFLFLYFEQPAFFSIRGYISFIRPDQEMWYCACKTCNKKLTESMGDGYSMIVRVSDASSEAYISIFNEEAEKIIGCSADELNDLRSQEGEENPYLMKLKKATWIPHLLRVSVSQNENNNEKRQKITAVAVVPVDLAANLNFSLKIYRR
ncbi:replication factor-A carboxy-terminal domain protein [Medicago truncatula]|uniref:Replication factor-A carboxy-terminal domain protein n=1 Tax=Medicago truncatula TaxID=3880 RepID=A0A072UQC3_MEDTR|nr:replication factor-A carboxy-terminal domain protein [Medicago truncatula]